MEKNMGTIDKTIRIIIGFVIFGLYFANIITGTLAIILIILAGIFLLTSVFSFCPLYVPFGINTCKKK
jgi:hypothetical protein